MFVRLDFVYLPSRDVAADMLTRPAAEERLVGRRDF
jgi:hypothetical protein